jgi:hypothetical protein
MAGSPAMTSPLLRAALSALAAVAAVPALAAAPPTPTVAPATPLDGLTVAVSRTPPVVVSTFPATGATVRSGVTVLKVTFDQAMDAAAWDYAKGADGVLPSCLAKPRLLGDHRTFVLLCTTAPGARYAIRLNGDGARGFTGLGGRPASPYDLSFSTEPSDAVYSLPEALKVAGLKEDQNPVEGSAPANP